ncbi:MAG: lipopolysaccharide assembly protein LapA domain-containing protein [Brachybacterium sp.]
MTASDDPTRPTASPGGNDATRPDAPATEDAPPTGRRAAERPAQESQPGQKTQPGHETQPVQKTQPVEEPMAGGGKTAGMWIGLILGAIILVLLLIFVIQNNITAGFQYFGAEFDLPLGVAMLLAAIAGALVMALVGSVRMIQMSWTIRKLRKQQDKIHRATR